MLGLKMVKSASLGEPAEWEDEGEAAIRPRRPPTSVSRRRIQAPGCISGCGWITAKAAPYGS